MTTSADTAYAKDSRALRREERARAQGWLNFAGVLLGLMGTFNFIDGIAAIGNSHFYVGRAHYVVGDLKTWGWIIMLLGVAQGLTGLGILVGNQVARWAGAAFAFLNAIAQLLFIPSYPFWALAVFAIDLVVLYGLIAYGGTARE
jgi:hypothetical protein